MKAKNVYLIIALLLFAAMLTLRFAYGMNNMVVSLLCFPTAALYIMWSRRLSSFPRKLLDMILVVAVSFAFWGQLDLASILYPTASATTALIIGLFLEKKDKGR